MKITLCGSSRFYAHFNKWSKILSIAGHTVYSVGIAGRVAGDDKPAKLDVLSLAEKEMLDLVHLKKILDSDAIVVLNVEGYVGDSTRREILWAKILGKEAYFLEQHGHPTMPSVYRIYSVSNVAIALYAEKYS